MKPTDAQLAEWARLTEAATPGPWEADLSPGSDPDEGIPNHGWVWPPKTHSDSERDYMLWEDVQFCAAARDAMPVLLAEVKRIREAEEGLDLLAADIDKLKILSLDHTGLRIAADRSYGIRLAFWSLYQAVKDCSNYLQTEINPEVECEIRIAGSYEPLRYFLTVVKPGGKSPHELRTEAEAANARLREALEAVLPEADRLRCRKFSRGEAVLGGDWDCCDWREWHAEAEAALRGSDPDEGIPNHRGRPVMHWTEECSEDENCLFCTGEACALCCGAGSFSDCEHDSYERHCSWAGQPRRRASLHGEGEA